MSPDSCSEKSALHPLSTLFSQVSSYLPRTQPVDTYRWGTEACHRASSLLWLWIVPMMTFQSLREVPSPAWRWFPVSLQLSLRINWEQRGPGTDPQNLFRVFQWHLHPTEDPVSGSLLKVKFRSFSSHQGCIVGTHLPISPPATSTSLPVFKSSQ